MLSFSNKLPLDIRLYTFVARSFREVVAPVGKVHLILSVVFFIYKISKDESEHQDDSQTRQHCDLCFAIIKIAYKPDAPYNYDPNYTRGKSYSWWSVHELLP